MSDAYDVWLLYAVYTVYDVDEVYVMYTFLMIDRQDGEAGGRHFVHAKCADNGNTRDLNPGRYGRHRCGHRYLLLCLI